MSNESEWSSEWPTEPGWYWTFDPDSCRPRQEPGQAILIGGKDIIHGIGGAVAYKREWPSLLWGPRIPIPDAPNGLPGTRYVLGRSDGDGMVWRTSGGTWSRDRVEAMIFDDPIYAEGLTRIGYDDRVVAIDCVDEFRSRGTK